MTRRIATMSYEPLIGKSYKKWPERLVTGELETMRLLGFECGREESLPVCFSARWLANCLKDAATCMAHQLQTPSES